ncbi:hypothetical protein LCGC14_2253330, partial [marine sediment metagenome]
GWCVWMVVMLMDLSRGGFWCSTNIRSQFVAFDGSVSRIFHVKHPFSRHLRPLAHRLLGDPEVTR